MDGGSQLISLLSIWIAWKIQLFRAWLATGTTWMKVLSSNKFRPCQLLVTVSIQAHSDGIRIARDATVRRPPTSRDAFPCNAPALHPTKTWRLLSHRPQIFEVPATQSCGNISDLFCAILPSRNSEMPRCERSRLGTWCYLCGRMVGAGEDDGSWDFRLLLASDHDGAYPCARQAAGVKQP